MAKPTVRYVRKLSGEEALERYVMVLKDMLKIFPKPGVPFTVKIGRKEFETQVKAVDCWCQGPKKPHVHYRIDLSPFVSVFRPHFGQTVTFEKVSDAVFKLKM
jgi:hypothetical protein